MKRRIFVALAALVALGTVGAVSAIRSSAGQNDPEELRRRTGKAFEEGGLPAAAKVAGSYRMTMSPHGSREAESLAFLVENSALIVIGQIRRNRGWLNERADMITTDYEVAVERTLKGDVKPGDRVTVSVIGGRVGFPGGTWAQVDTLGWTPPFNNQVFVMFLEFSDFHPSAAQRAKARGPIYMPAFMSRGLYLINNGIINPKTFSTHPLARAYAGKPEAVLVNDVLDLVEKREPTGPRATGKGRGR